MSSEGGGSGSNNPGGTRPVFPTRARQRVQAPDPGPALPRAAAFQPKVVRQLEPTIPEPAPARAAPPPAQAPAPAPRQFPNVGRDAPLAPPPTPGSASKSYTTGPNVLQATNITSTQPRNAYGVTPPQPQYPRTTTSLHSPLGGNRGRALMSHRGPPPKGCRTKVSCRSIARISTTMSARNDRITRRYTLKTSRSLLEGQNGSTHGQS